MSGSKPSAASLQGRHDNISHIAGGAPETSVLRADRAAHPEPPLNAAEKAERHRVLAAIGSAPGGGGRSRDRLRPRARGYHADALFPLFAACGIIRLIGSGSVLANPIENSNPASARRRPKILESKENLGGYRLGEVNTRRESRPPETHSEHMAPAQGARPSTKNGRVPWAFQVRSTDGETVRVGNDGGGRGTVVEPSSALFSMSYKVHFLWWMLTGKS